MLVWKDINVIFHSPQSLTVVLLLSKHVEEALVPRAAVHAGGVSLVEQGGGHPGQQERHPASQHDHPHLILILS